MAALAEPVSLGIGYGLSHFKSSRLNLLALVADLLDLRVCGLDYLRSILTNLDLKFDKFLHSFILNKLG